jgi:hypothetical protein
VGSSSNPKSCGAGAKAPAERRSPTQQGMAIHGVRRLAVGLARADPPDDSGERKPDFSGAAELPF